MDTACRSGVSSSCPDSGFTLVELIVALAVFLIVSAATLGLIIRALDAVQGNRARVYAAAVARQQLDSVRALGTSAIPLGASTSSVTTTQGDVYTVTTTATWINLGLTTNPCSVGQGVTPGKSYMRVQVDVTNKELGAPQRVVSILYPTATQQDVNTGTITVAVSDDAGKPVGGVLVNGSNGAGGTFSQVTGPDGCIFAPDLATGTWSVTISKSGYITQTVSGTTSSGISVQALKNSPVTFTYAAAGSMIFTAGSATYPVPAGVPFTFTPDTRNRAPSTFTSYPVTVTDLWPAAYTGWLRPCKTSVDGAPASASLPAGSTATLTLKGTRLDLVGPKGATVTAQYTSANCNATYTLGTIPSTYLLTATLPAGTWTLTASGASPATKTTTLATTTNLCSVSWNVPGAVGGGGSTPSPTPTPTSTPTSTATATPTPSPSIVLPTVSTPCP